MNIATPTTSLTRACTCARKRGERGLDRINDKGKKRGTYYKHRYRHRVLTRSRTTRDQDLLVLRGVSKAPIRPRDVVHCWGERARVSAKCPSCTCHWGTEIVTVVLSLRYPCLRTGGRRGEEGTRRTAELPKNNSRTSCALLITQAHPASQPASPQETIRVRGWVRSFRG